MSQALGAEDDHLRSPQEIAYRLWRVQENAYLDARCQAHERLEEALEELSRSWGWTDLSRQIAECEKAIQEVKEVFAPRQLQLVPDSPTEGEVRLVCNG